MNIFKKIFCKKPITKGYMEDEVITDNPIVDVHQQSNIIPFEGLHPIGEDAPPFSEPAPDEPGGGEAAAQGHAEHVAETTPCQASGNFEKLLSEQAQLVKNYDTLAAQMEGGSRELLLDVIQKTIDNLLLAGCQPIMGETAYDMKRHRPEPYMLATPGTPVKQTLRQGVEWNGRVYIPAIVELTLDRP